MKKNYEPLPTAYANFMSDFVSHIEDLSVDNYEEVIIQSLQKLQKLLNIYQIGFVQIDPISKSRILYNNLYSKSINLSTLYKDADNTFSFFYKKIINNEIINISHKNKLPAEAINERKLFEENGIVSFLFIPYLPVNKRLYGIICTEKKEVNWSKSLITELFIFSRYIVFQIEKNHNLKELKESESKFKTVADYTYDLECWRNTAGSFEYISPSSKRITGYSNKEFYERPELMNEIIYPDDLPKWEKYLEVLLHGDKLFEIELRIIKKDGGICWICHNGQQMLDENGNFIGWRTSSRDITDRKVIEDNLEKAFEEIKKLKNKLQDENIFLKDSIIATHEFASITTDNQAMLEILKQVKQVAKADSIVLINGETGTGKELIAQAIHDRSNRNKNLMVTINCAAIPAALIESELFGRERGAYTGAITRQIGRFEMANNSTIFLDEVGDLPLETQAKLLRIIQFGEYQMLGSPKTRKVNVRIVAATNRKITDLIEEGLFRSDLYFRLNVFPIFLPPLRDRKEDIPLLVWEFVREFSKKMGKRIDRISNKNMEKLVAYNWPGNLRELRNIVEYSIILTESKTLNIQFHDRHETIKTSGVTLEEVEREHIHQTLKKTNWLISGKNGAAKLLDLKESTLRFRMKKLGIVKE